MSLLVIPKKQEAGESLRYLTYSILKDFLTCPEKGRLSHIRKLKKPGIKSVLLFGTGLHLGIEGYYEGKTNPVNTFEVFWTDVASKEEIEYKEGESAEELLRAGKELLLKWMKHEETPDDYDLIESEQRIEIYGIPFYATIDFVGNNGKLLIDWKTSSYRYNPLKAEYDLQLTVYSYVLAEVREKTPEKVGFGVFIKKKEPEVQYVWGRGRTKEDFRNFEKMVLKVWSDVEKGEFYKNPGMHCQWCDFLPLCIGEVDESAYVRKDDSYYKKYDGEVE